MIKLDGVAAFLAIAEAGSVSAAARRLGNAKSVISDRLTELERTLGTRLVQRTARKRSLTEDGQTFLPRAQRILRESLEAAAELAERRGTLIGPLRISAPLGFGALHLAPALYAFLAEHSGIELTLELDDRFVDAAGDGFDAVLRHGPVGDNRLIARRLAKSQRMLVASPDYLSRHGTPSSPDELERHSGILYSNRNTDWRFSGPNGRIGIRPRVGLRVNNGMVMRDAAVAGLGIALLPTFFTHSELNKGLLIRIEVGMQAEGAELFMAYPRERHVSAKILALIESLRKSFGDPPYWDC